MPDSNRSGVRSPLNRCRLAAGITVSGMMLSADVGLLGFVMFLILLAGGATGGSGSRRARLQGAAGERAVLEELSRLDARYARYCNRLVPGVRGRAPETDIVIARADVVFVIEVKSSAVPVALKPEGMHQLGRGGIRRLRDPRTQAQGQARAVRRFLRDWGVHVPVIPLVVVLTPELSIQGSKWPRVVRTPRELLGVILDARPRQGQGGDPRAVLDRLPHRDRIWGFR